MAIRLEAITERLAWRVAATDETDGARGLGVELRRGNRSRRGRCGRVLSVRFNCRLRAIGRRGRGVRARRDNCRCESEGRKWLPALRGVHQKISMVRARPGCTDRGKQRSASRITPTREARLNKPLTDIQADAQDSGLAVPRRREAARGRGRSKTPGSNSSRIYAGADGTAEQSHCVLLIHSHAAGMLDEARSWLMPRARSGRLCPRR